MVTKWNKDYGERKVSILQKESVNVTANFIAQVAKISIFYCIDHNTDSIISKDKKKNDINFPS